MSNALDFHMNNFFMTLGATNGYDSKEIEKLNMNVLGTENEVGFKTRGMNKDKSED